MQKIDLVQDVWTEVFTNVTSQNFHLINYPDKARARGYKIHYGSIMPSDDTDIFIFYSMRAQSEILVTLNNTIATNIYIMPIYDDGKIIF